MTLSQELDRPAPDAVQAIARALVAAHGDTIIAILFYGSCRRTGDTTGLIDLAILYDGHFAYHRRRVPAVFNALLPPNVVLFETACGSQPVRAKIALYAAPQFRSHMRQASLDSTVWARFCQPASLLHARDGAARLHVEAAIAEGIHTAAAWASRFARPGESPWTSLFRRTYDAELRPEAPGRAAMIYQQNQAWFDAIPLSSPAGRSWTLRIAAGKSLNVLRLIKAAFTFNGGADYIVWKLQRHAGIQLHLTDWQRRHPLLAVPFVLMRLWRRRG